MTVTRGGLQLAVQQLTDIADARPGGLEILQVSPDGVGNKGEISISLNLTGVPDAPNGAKVRDFERFTIIVPETFPFKPPTVTVPHLRWAGVPHVQWGRLLCLYAAPSVEWNPCDGMRGLAERLLLWVEKAAIGALDPDDRPLHPPTAYRGTADELVVIHADIGDRAPWQGDTSNAPTYLIAVCERRGDRFDVIDWHDMEHFAIPETGEAAPVDGVQRVAAAAILIDGDLGFEYPSRGGDLAMGLGRFGVDNDSLLSCLATAAAVNAASNSDADIPLILFVGTPSRHFGRGPRLAHLVAWRLDELGHDIAGLIAGAAALDAPELQRTILKLGDSWISIARTNWLAVLENRPEVTVRRDTGSSATWLAGKRVLILGCGALGAPIAAHSVRARAATVTVVDNGIVTPGILVRQPYTDADIGMSKAASLAQHLVAIDPKCDVTALVADIVELATDPASALPTYDLIVDATADTGVRAVLETVRMSADTWPATVTVLIGHQARRGLVAISRPGASGGAHDIFRRLGIAVAGPRGGDYSDVAADFYPDPPRSNVFQPEPGCSAPTFTGSSVEAAALAASMISAALDAITGRAPASSQQPMAVAAVRLDDDAVTGWLGWPNDTIVKEQGGLQVRVSRAAFAEMRAEARRGVRVRGPGIETGGMLIGAIDEAVGCLFVDTATGPPPDSRLSEAYFEHGTQGVQDIVDHHLRQSRNFSGFIGMWHTHPYGLAAPSRTDQQGMTNLVAPITGGPSHATMLIIGGAQKTWEAWLDGRDERARPDFFAQLVRSAGGPSPRLQIAPNASYHVGGYGSAPPHRASEVKMRWWRRLRAPWIGRR